MKEQIEFLFWSLADHSFFWTKGDQFKPEFGECMRKLVIPPALRPLADRLEFRRAVEAILQNALPKAEVSDPRYLPPGLCKLLQQEQVWYVVCEGNVYPALKDVPAPSGKKKQTRFIFTDQSALPDFLREGGQSDAGLSASVREFLRQVWIGAGEDVVETFPLVGG